MKDSVAGKLFCIMSPALGALAHMSLLYIGRPLPFPIVGGIGAGAGIAGVLLCLRARRRATEDIPIHWAFILIAVLGIFVGLFYASMIGPLILFFPRI